MLLRRLGYVSEEDRGRRSNNQVIKKITYILIYMVKLALLGPGLIG
jgi:hypothetical protein